MNILSSDSFFKVNGCVLLPGVGQVGGRIIVKAFYKDLRREVLLGENITNSEGEYEISYRPKDFHQAKKQTIDLITRAYDDKGEEIACSPVVFNAEHEETIDLTIDALKYRGPSEYQRHLDALIPLLQEVSLTDLKEEDIDFLVGKTGIERKAIDRLVLATVLPRR